MPEADARTDKNFFLDIPVPNQGFFLKGSASYDWGMKNRLSRIFRPDSGHTVMLAIDHGYFQGPTTGLERVDVTILPLAPYADALMCTRGILRSTIPATHRGGVVIRASGGPSILKELSNENTALDLDDAARMNVDAVAVQVFIGGEYETQSIKNLTKLVDDGYRAGIPVLGVTAVGKDMVRDERYFGLATRHVCRARCPDREDLLLRGLRERHRRLPGPHRHGRGQEAPRARSAHDGLQGHRRGRRRRRHGPQHLPVHLPCGHDPGRGQGRPRRAQARRGLRGLQRAFF